MAANYLAKALLAGANLIGKAFVQSYRRVAGEGAQAKAEKAAEGAAVKDASAAFVAKRRMRLDEAKKVLNLDPAAETQPPEEYAKLVNDRYETLYKANALPHGSFYLQSKIFRAKESMEDEFQKKFGLSLVPKGTGNTTAGAAPAAEGAAAAAAAATPKTGAQ